MPTCLLEMDAWLAAFAAVAACLAWAALGAPSRRRGLSPRSWRGGVGGGFRRRSQSPRTVTRDVASERRKILFLISDTGGGHRASADALVEALSHVAPEIDADVEDVLTDVAPWPYNQAVPLYKFLAAHPALWRLVWYGTALFDAVVSDGAPWPGCVGPFKRHLERARADLVVSVHPMLQSGPLDALAAMERETGVKTPFATVVTDLGAAHPTWFSRRADRVFVPSKVLRDAALAKGAKAEAVVTHGLPIRSAFSRAGDAAAAKAALGLAADKKVVLVMGGGDGFGALRDIVRALVTTCDAETTTVVAACGRNAALKAQIEAEGARNVVALGFTTAIHEWMTAADLLLTKAGPGTIAEAAALGLPVILTGYLPGQEFGNVSYVKDAGFGDFEGDPAAVAEKAAAWLQDAAKLCTLTASARKAARPRATDDIAKDLAAMAL